MLMLILGLVFSLVAAAQQIVASTPAQGPAGAPPVRFDYVVRADFFAGFAGDAEKLSHAMATCEQYLAANPDHPEALVWHGAGLVFQAGQAFRAADATRGGELWTRGLAEMSRAVALAPDNVGVRVPRGAILLQAVRGMPEERQRPLLELAVDDYERALDLQTPNFSSLSEHARGQLLYGLADGSARLGRTEQARDYFNRLLSSTPESPLAPRARQWLSEGTLPPERGLGCVGCHK